MKVAAAILDKRFLKGTHAIEYIHGYEGCPNPKDAYWVHQVAATADDQAPMLIERHRAFKTTLADPLPPWRVMRGSTCGPHGFAGLWLPHLPTLLKRCRLVPLKKKDRPVFNPEDSSRADRRR